MNSNLVHTQNTHLKFIVKVCFKNAVTFLCNMNLMGFFTGVASQQNYQCRSFLISHRGFQLSQAHNKALVRMQTTLRFVCTAQLGRYA